MMNSNNDIPFLSQNKLKEEVVRYVHAAAGKFYDTGVKKTWCTACKNASIATGIM